MAMIRRSLAGLLAAMLLCGCAAQTAGTQAEQQTQTPQADAGSAQPSDTGQQLTDPPVDEQQTQTPQADADSTQPSDTGQQLTDPPIDEQETEQPLTGVIICLDAGHGVTDETAQERVSPLSEETKAAYVSGASGASQTEEELNLAVAQLTQAALTRLGAQVVMTRTVNEIALGNIQRAQIANEAGADLCIRIHADGADDTTVSGMSMQVPAGELLGTPEIEQPSAQAAQIILDCVTEATGAKNRGLTQRSDLTGFNWSEVPCILLEMGFLSNPEEDATLAREDYRQSIADGIAQGVCRWNEQERG